jgi:WD40 repeat protein
MCELRVPQHETWITGLAADARRVVTGSNDRTVVVWDRVDGHWSHILKGAAGQITAVGLHGDVAVAAARDKTLRLWDMVTEAQLACVSPPARDLVNGVAVDEHLVVAACTANVLRVFCRRSGKWVRELHGHAGPVYGVDMQVSFALSRCCVYLPSQSWPL